MIARIQTIEEILPIFRTYLEEISKFYEICNVNAWRDTAVKNLKRDAGSKERRIYCITESESIIGFAMVNKHLRFNQDGFAVAEFYVGTDHSGRGWGRKLAEHVFAQYKGNWEVAVSGKNKEGLGFWKKVISSHTSGDFMEKNKASFMGNGFLFNNAD